MSSLQISSLQAIFDHAPPYTRAHYTVDGVTSAIVVNLPPAASEGSPDSHLLHYLLRILQHAQFRELVVSAPDLAVRLAECTPPIPIQRGWAIDRTGAGAHAED